MISGGELWHNATELAKENGTLEDELEHDFELGTFDQEEVLKRKQTDLQRPPSI